MNVVITGASKGIGFQLAQEFAKRGASKIVGISRNYKQLCQLREICHEKYPKTDFIAVAYDLQGIMQNEPQLAGLIKQNLSSIDILINNAGLVNVKPFESVSAEDIMRVFNVNYFGPALLTKNLISLLKNTQGHVVNITSMGGFQGSTKFRGLSHYSASKAALAVLTECLAEEYKKEGIVFNALAFGAVQTEMLEEAFPGFKAPLTPEEAAVFIADFAINGRKFFNGKILPVSINTP
ncbi:MAG: SDR family oxidoreductase [Bacteroidetes bacterium]|nr:SDR family oxidoreductase [Bacteroidota bacterium]